MRAAPFSYSVAPIGMQTALTPYGLSDGQIGGRYEQS